MVSSLLNPPSQNYLLLHRFKMPTKHGIRDAISVTAGDGDKLISAYTFLLEHIVTVVWGIAVLIMLLISIRRYDADHPSTPISTEIWYKRSSPLVILQLVLKVFLQVTHSRWLILMWIFMALGFTVSKYVIPIIFAPYIKIGNGAPVSPSHIFLPSRNNTGNIFSLSSDQDLLQIFNFYVPLALRAVANVDSINASDPRPHITVDQPTVIQDRGNGEKVIQLGYSYSVTGLDFGLQYFPDLVFNVEGSCKTEYSWTLGTYPDNENPGSFLDEYAVFGDPNSVQTVSPFDGGPRAFFSFAPPQDPNNPYNSTWAAFVSSVNRTSFFNGTDPWYLTDNNPLFSDQSVFPFIVRPRRPALSCWESDVWSYKGKNYSTTNLDAILPRGLATGLASFLVEPMIYFLGLYLQVSALKSSVTALTNILDANTSTIFNDVERLVYASYIATVNCLTETTLFPPANGFPNQVAPNGILLDGAADFVIYSSDIATLEVRALIIIPIIAAALWIFSIILLILPIPGKEVSTLNAFDKPADLEPEEKESKMKKIASAALKQALSNVEGTGSQDPITSS